MKTKTEIETALTKYRALFEKAIAQADLYSYSLDSDDFEKVARISIFYLDKVQTMNVIHAEHYLSGVVKSLEWVLKNEP
jgi:hypothetical protein